MSSITSPFIARTGSAFAVTTVMTAQAKSASCVSQ